ncbi:MAG: hypothetical protein Kow0069_14480 [Promethearchaeota archaeon]
MYQLAAGPLVFLVPFTFASVVVVLSLFVFFAVKAVTTRQKMFRALAGLFLAYVVTHVASMSYIVAETAERQRVAFLQVQVFELLSVYGLVLVLEMFESNRVVAGRQVLFVVLVSMTLGALLSNPPLTSVSVSGRDLVVFARPALAPLLRLLFDLVAATWMFVVLVRSYRSAKVKKQRGLVLALVVGLVLSQLVGSALPTTIEEIPRDAPPVDLLGVAVLVGFAQNVGMIIVGFGFLWVQNYPWLLQHQRVLLLVVYKPEGTTIFAKTFSERISDSDAILFTGGVSAVAALFGETTKTSTPIKAILFEDFELRVVQRPLFTCALVEEYSSQATEEAHKRFVEEFETRFSDELKAGGANVSAFQAAGEIAARYFAE